MVFITFPEHLYIAGSLCITLLIITSGYLSMDLFISSSSQPSPCIAFYCTLYCTALYLPIFIVDLAFVLYVSNIYCNVLYYYCIVLYHDNLAEHIVYLSSFIVCGMCNLIIIVAVYGQCICPLTIYYWQYWPFIAFIMPN